MERNELEAIVDARLRAFYGPSWREQLAGGELKAPEGHPRPHEWTPCAMGRSSWFDEGAQEWVTYPYDVHSMWSPWKTFYGNVLTVHVCIGRDSDGDETFGWYVGPYVGRAARPRYFP